MCRDVLILPGVVVLGMETHLRDLAHLAAKEVGKCHLALHEEGRGTGCAHQPAVPAVVPWGGSPPVNVLLPCVPPRGALCV